MKIFLFLITVFTSNYLYAQTVNDSNFANALRNLYPNLIEANTNNLTAAATTYTGSLDFSGWGNATKSDGTVSAFASQPKLITIEGIASFTQLSGLDVSNQQLITIPVLSNSVLFIVATNNQITSLPNSLPSSLEYLRVSQNRLSQLPVLPTSLKALKCNDNQLTSLPTLPNLLAYLDVSNNIALACLPSIPNNLVNNSLPSSTLTTYVFSSWSLNRVNFTGTSIRCIPNFYSDAWGYGITAPTAPGACYETPIYRSSVVGADIGLTNGRISVTGILPSPNAKIEYKLDNGLYSTTNLFSNLSAGSYTIYARRKSESTLCTNPSSSVTIAIPSKNNITIYVSPTGNDSTGSGSQANPYKSIVKALSTTYEGSGATIHLAEGAYIENEQIVVPNTVSIIGSGSDRTFIQVNLYYNPFDYPTSNNGANPLSNSYNNDVNFFIIKLSGGGSTLKGFSIDGQAKKCLGAVYGAYANDCLIDDLNIQNFRFSGIYIQFADNTTIQNCYIKNSTYGTFTDDKACIFIDGTNILLKKNTLIINENIGGYGIKNTFPVYANVQFFQVPDLMKEDEYSLNVILEDNTVLVNSSGLWNNYQAPGFVFENFQTCKSCIFRNNIFNGTMSLVDAGSHSNGSYYNGPRYDIYNNTFNMYDGGYIVESMSPQIEFHHNYVFGGGGLNSFGSASDDLNYHHNVFYNLRGVYPLSFWVSPPSRFRFNNNTIIDYRGSSILLGNNTSNKSVEVKNNIFANVNPSITSTPSNDIGQLAGSNSVISNNLYYTIPSYGINSIIANPQIAASGLKPYTFFQLKKGSPAIDAGLIIPGTTDNFKGDAPDLGAYESDYTTNLSSLYGNWIGIGTDKQEKSVILDVSSSSQGLLIPRLSQTNIQNIASPAAGLLIFCSDCSPSCFYISDGLNWLKQIGGETLGTINTQPNTGKSLASIGTSSPNSSAIFDISDSNRGLLLPRIQTFASISNPVESMLVYLDTEPNQGVYFYNGTQWAKAFNTQVVFPVNTAPSLYSNSNGIGINTETRHSSSVIEINSHDRGMLIPRLGKSQMETIQSPAVGLLVYCFDCPSKGFYYNNGTNWQNTVVTPPSEPQKVIASPIGNTVVVSFTVPLTNGGNTISSYTVRSIPGNISMSTTNTSVVFTNLTAGVAYVFLVTANNSEGSSTSSASNPIIFNVPSTPTNVYAFRGQGAGAVDVYFSTPSETGGSPILNYTLKSFPGNQTFTATQSPFTITGLTINTKYTFTITANNIVGSSLPALTAATTTGPEISQTHKILDNIVSPNVAYSLRKLKSTYNGPAIELRRSSDNQKITIGFDTEGNLNTQLISQFCGSNNGFVSKWYDQSGNGKDLVNLTDSQQPTIYNAVSGITLFSGKPALDFFSSGLFLRTNDVVLQNANELTTFSFAYGGYYATIFQHGNTSGSGHFYGRREFINYGFNLAGSVLEEIRYNNGATGEQQNLLVFRNSVTDNRRHLRRNGTNSNSINTSVNVTFTNDKLTIGGGFTGKIAEHIEFSSYLPLSSVELIENNQSLFFSISQPCLAGAIPPIAPTQIFASSSSSTSASISFVPPSSSGSLPINYYEVISSPGNVKATGTASPITILGLTAGISYNFVVKAVNFCDESASGISNTIVLGQVNAPANVTAQKGVEEGSAIITFTPPTFTNNQNITGYTITSSPDNIQTIGSASPISVTGLSNEKKYTFTVVTNTSSNSSLPSLESNSLYAHTQLLHDLPTPKTAFALRRLLSTYNGPLVNIRRNDNTTQDIGFLSNGELDEAALLGFVGSGNGFVTTWYDQSGNTNHASVSTTTDQPLLVSNGVVCKHQGQPTLRFYGSDRLYIPALSNIKALHTIFSMGDATSGGTNSTNLDYGSFINQTYTSNFGGNGLNHDWQNSLSNLLRWSGTFYEPATLTINGIDKTYIANNYGPNIREYKSVIGNVNNSINASFTVKDFRANGSNYSNIAVLVLFSQNIVTTDRIKIDKRQSACFELGF